MIFPKKGVNKQIIKSNILELSFLDNGNLCEIRDGIIRVNTYVGSYFNPCLNNIYLKIVKDNNIYYTRLMGNNSLSEFVINDNKAYYKGSFMGVDYTIIISICDNVFYYQVDLKKTPSILKACLYYGLDVSIHNIYAIRNNEAYVSQYIDHFIDRVGDSYIICSRQNQETSVYLEVGSFNKTIGYATDGFDFFKTSFKETNNPACIFDETLCNRNYQYEFSYSSLQSEYFDLNENKTVVFYNAYTLNHPEQIKANMFYDYAKERFNLLKFNNKLSFNKIVSNYSLENIINSNSIDDELLNKLFGNKVYAEYDGTTLLSFFTKSGSHVVLKEKEVRLERPSGNIIYTQNKVNDEYDFENVIASTGYMNGLFNSQVVCGNVTFNKLLSNLRNPLNILKSSGMRILIKIDNHYRLLNMPACFEMGINYLKWIYIINDDILEIKSFTSASNSKLMFEFKSLNNIKYDLIIFSFLAMGEIENESKEVLDLLSNNKLRVSFIDGSMTKGKYPDLYFEYVCDKEFKFNDDSFYFNNYSSGENMFMLSLNESEFKLLIKNNKEDDSFINFEEEVNKYNKEINDFKNDFKIESSNELVNSNNYLINWFIHDALIHYLTPHGLEQYNGAAWGTRDVCQGPFELFLSFGKYKYARRIILDVFNHQFFETGDFPQWFMFDKFYNILDLSSHGDIIVWPLRMVTMYLKETSDYSVLKETVPYILRDSISFDNCETILDHIRKLFNYILNNNIQGTHLLCYGGGDWDDTLQPADSKLKSEMVSGWTPLLLYEVLVDASLIFKEVDASLAKQMDEYREYLKVDYNKYLMKDNIPAGFIHFDNENNKLMIHPSNNEVLKYRLLPLSRGVKSGLFNDEQKEIALSIIKENLIFPDGIRLMNHAVKYQGGIKNYFNRAETAANFGREIGLSYSHANIRCAEMFSSVGLTDDAITALNKVNPLIVNEFVSNAALRQRNSYFSSSDGAFNDRYDAYDNFEKLKGGMVSAKAGWRVYSSGPGIYIHTLISEVLGIKQSKDLLYFNSNGSKSLNDLSVSFKFEKKNITIKYAEGPKQIIFNGKTINNNFVKKKDLKEDNEIIIYSPLDILCESSSDIELIKKEMKGCFDYFLEQSNLDSSSLYGLTKDIYEVGVNHNISSIAATGFALSAYVVGVERKYITKEDGYNIVNKTLDTVINLSHYHGFLPHFINLDTGDINKSEYSTIDTCILLMGAITAGEYFGKEIKKKVEFLIDRLDFSVFERTKEDKLFINMAYSDFYWKENDGYCPACWDHYAEQLMMYFIYAGRKYSDPVKSKLLYDSFERHKGTYEGYEVIYSYKNPLFVHQFSHAFINFKNLVDSNGINWFDNSVNATLANKAYCMAHTQFKTYNEHSWGLTAFKGRTHYQVLGSKPNGFINNPVIDDTDGSVAPYAALSSIVFTENDSLDALRYFNLVDGLNGKYGLYDAYNFDTSFISKAYLGIDKGPTLIMLDNYLYGTTWKYFMRSSIYERAINILGFKKRKGLKK